MRYQGLLDCNNFFVSCERLFRPDLRNRPTVVLSSNDGCVVARSQEIKDMGIPMGVPYFKVKDELEKDKVAVFSGNMPLYRDISARVMNVLAAEVGSIEKYSVDEAFFSINVSSHEVEEYIRHVKSVIEQSIGIPVSIGAAKTKTIAKYASEYKKKGIGYAFLEGSSWRELTSDIPISTIWGIGSKTSKKLREQGVVTVEDFLASDPARIKKVFGIGTLRIHNELQEVPVFHRERDHELQKSIMSTRSFKQNLTSLSDLNEAVTYHVEHVSKQLRELQAEAGIIRILLQTSRHGDWAFRGGSKESVLEVPTNDTRVLLRNALKLTQNLYEAGVPYKKAGVIVSDIRSTIGKTNTLFEEVTSNERPALMDAIDQLNQRLGKSTITFGRVGRNLFQSSRDYISPQYTTQWTDVPSIKA